MPKETEKTKHTKKQNAVIKVVGVGDGGGQIVRKMVERPIYGVGFLVIAEDPQLFEDLDPTVVLGIGLDPASRFRPYSEPTDNGMIPEAEQKIEDSLRGADFVIITADIRNRAERVLANFVAEMAKIQGALCVAVIIEPWSLEEKPSPGAAKVFMRLLEFAADSVIAFPAEWPEEFDRLPSHNGKESHSRILQCISGLCSLLASPGLINVDLVDLRAAFSNIATATFSVGSASGDNRASSAVETAMQGNGIKEFDLKSARSILVGIRADRNLSIGEFSDIGDAIEGALSKSSDVIVGTAFAEGLGDELEVFIIAPAGDRKGQVKPFRFAREELKKPAERDAHWPAHEQTTEQKRRQTSDKNQESTGRSVAVVASADSSDDDIASVVYHLSNVYRSVGGDELVVNDVMTLPPDPTVKVDQGSARTRESRG